MFYYFLFCLVDIILYYLRFIHNIKSLPHCLLFRLFSNFKNFNPIRVSWKHPLCHTETEMTFPEHLRTSMKPLQGEMKKGLPAEQIEKLLFIQYNSLFEAIGLEKARPSPGLESNALGSPMLHVAQPKSPLFLHSTCSSSETEKLLLVIGSK